MVFANDLILRPIIHLIVSILAPQEIYDWNERMLNVGSTTFFAGPNWRIDA